jgi:AcrR family transcriptional regulator
MARKRNAETAAKIAAAATELFCTQGYVDTTMAAIAAGAGVSVQTLYLRHGSKAAILSAALDVAIAGDAEPITVTEREGFFAHALAEGEAAKAIAIWAHGARTICDRTSGLYAVIRSAAADPEVAEVLTKSRHDRAVSHLLLAEALREKRGYAKRVAVDRAADLMYGLGTEDSYLIFVVDRGWSPDDWEQWVVDTVRSQLTTERSNGGATSRRVAGTPPDPPPGGPEVSSRP